MRSPCPRLTSQSGALFGLDARIALAVFGLLAIIVGVVSFGRVEIARKASVIAELEAFENALNHYQADMNVFLPFTTNKPAGDDLSAADTDLEALWSRELVKIGFHPSWNGPYLQRESRKHPTYGTYGLVYAPPLERTSTCTEDTPCFLWLSLSQVPADIWKTINSYFDEAHGREREANPTTTGRVQSDSTGATRTLYFRTTAQRPNL